MQSVYLLEEHGFDNPFGGIFLSFILHFHISYFFFFIEGTSLPGFVDRSVIEILRVQLVADILRHRLGADIDANRCSGVQQIFYCC